MPTIFELIDAGAADELRTRLDAEPQLAAARDAAGLTALMRAAYRGGAVYDVVLAAGPPLDPFDRIMVGHDDGLPTADARTPDGFTGLHIAAFAHNARAAAALLADGADPNVLATASFARVTPLGTCAFAGANDVARLLLDHGADPDLTAEPGGGTPLMSAEQNGNEELVELLLANGATR